MSSVKTSHNLVVRILIQVYGNNYSRSSSHFLLDTLFEASPALLPAVTLEAPVDAVLHHGDKLLVAQKAVPVVVEYLENCMYHMGTEFLSSADVNCSTKLFLGYWFVYQRVHLHCNLEVVKVVEEHTEVLELLEGDALLLRQPLAQTLQDVVVVLRVEQGDLSKMRAKSSSEIAGAPFENSPNSM